VNTIQAVGHNPSLLSVSTRLFGWLWEKQDHVFTHLLNYITTPLTAIPSETRTEIELSRAAVVREICLRKPELHGERLLSVLNGLVCSRNAVVMSMAIEGLASLCKSEVVDIVTLWGVLGKTLVKDQR